ncbi:hypothetical protein HMPREF3191_01387 [Veillonellaceae bacterium DNF00626]|nr:hypothetical protein HMPREF3191_01387 [Veillonellaceae bacterium DNF00626]
MYEYDSSGIVNDYNGFTTFIVIQYILSLFRYKLVIFIMIFRGFLMTATVLQHLKLHKLFTFSAHGESTGAARDRGKLE